MDSIGIKSLLSALVMVISIILFVVNSVDQQYRGAAFFGIYVLWLTPVMLLLFFISVAIRKKYTRVAFF